MPFKARVLFWSTVLTASFAGLCFFPDPGYIAKNVLVISVFAVFGFVSETLELEVLPRHQFSVSGAIYLSVVYIGDIPMAAAVSLPAVIASEVVIRWLESRDGQSLTDYFERIAFNTAQILLSVVASGLVYKLLGGTAPLFENLYQFLPPAVAFSVYIILNTSFVSGIISLSTGENFFYQLRFSLRKLHIQVLSLGVLSIIIAVTYESSPWNLLLIAVLLLLVNNSLKGYIQLRDQAKRTFEKIMDLLEKRDPYTRDHSESVGSLTEEICDELNLTPEEKESLVSAARVHDIGKLGIPDSILLKEGKLSDEEWETMEEHPVISADIISELEIYDDSVKIVKYEHERWDGSGYPEGLEGEDIPLGSRIVAVADVWNALRTERPYRGPIPVEGAKEEIKDMAGVKLDPEVVDALLTLVEEGRAEVKK